jgi:hypothetical protein
MYLYKYGGIYADLDFQCLQSFDPIIKKMADFGVDVCLGTMGIMDQPRFDLHAVPNALMMSVPGAEFWKFLINALKNSTVSDLSPEVQTGPVFLRFCLDAYISKKIDKPFINEVYGADIFDNIDSVEYSSKIYIMNPEVLYPINWDNKNHLVYRQRLYDHDELRVLFPSAFAVTFWMHSW